MRIALCDADKACTKITKNLLYQYANSHKFEFLVDVFYSGESLICSKEKYDIIFLEYKTGELNGFETAKIIRQRNDGCSIVFVSSYMDFILESFKVNPFRFLIKPLTEKLLFSTLDDFFKKYGKDYPLLIKDSENTFCLNTKDIFYVEANNKTCFVNLVKEKIHCNRTMARVFDILPKNHFIKINRAYVVNLNYICKYNNDEIVLSNGNNLHISRNYLRNFKNEYRLFLNAREP